MTARFLQDVSRAALRLAVTSPPTDLGNPKSPLDDLIYIILSGQTNEALYQNTFKALKDAFPRWQGIAQARVSDVAKFIEGGGLARQKAEYLKGILQRVEADWGRPTLAPLGSMGNKEAEEYLTSLPGVGIKTARCVLMYTLNREIFPADVNCLRIMERLGWIKWEGRRAELLADTAQELVPPHVRRTLHVNLVQHGRAICKSSAPLCENCCLQDLCEYSGKRELERPTVVDLCCGAGGFAWGFMQAGFDILLGVDTCRYALATFTANLPEAKALQLDITSQQAVEETCAQLQGQQPDIVIAGPPCQGFSRAGPRNPADPRNKVLHAVVQTAVKLQPKVIVVENVMYLRGPAFVQHLRKAIGVVRRAGYRFAYAVLNAEAFGVPQNRQRIVFVAARTETRAPLLKVLESLSRREAVQGMTVATAFAGLPVHGAGTSPVFNHEPMAHSQKVVNKIKKIKPGEGPLSYRKLDPDRLAPTVICGHRALPCHYAVPRTITVREAARLQGFWDDFRFFGPKGNQMLQVANAVPPRLAVGVALAVLELLGKTGHNNSKVLLEQLLRRMSYRPS
jgi:DNA (cytosine-5)-methyltransferase 1